MSGNLLRGLIKEHSHCAPYISDNSTKGLSYGFILGNYMECLMNSWYNDLIPNPKMVFEYIINEVQTFIKARPTHSVIIHLKSGSIWITNQMRSILFQDLKSNVILYLFLDHKSNEIYIVLDPKSNVLLYLFLAPFEYVVDIGIQRCSTEIRRITKG